MPSIFYSDNEAPFTGDPSKIDATRSFLNHYDNMLVLNFIMMNTKDRAEKQQAIKEIAISERKQKWAQNHFSFNKHAADIGVTELKKKWR